MNEVSEVTTKKWYQSKTMWFNLTVSIIAGAMGVLPFLQPALSPVVYGVIMFMVGLVNVILRSITNQGLE
jgi:hypothetical protein